MDKGKGAATERKDAAAPQRGTDKEKGEGKKKKAAAEPEPEPDPTFDSPLMIATATLAVRAGAAVDSEKVEGASVPVGSLMRVIEQVELITGITKLVTKRMKIVLEGDSEPLGWVTGVTPDNVENVRLANAGFPLMRAARVLICRDGKDSSSKKLEDISRHYPVRVIETFKMPDGVVKAKVGKDGPVTEEIGWITLSKPDKGDEANLEAVPKLTSTFDLKAHTAKSLSKALKRTQAGLKQAAASGARRKKRDGDGLPFMPAGRRPATKGADDGTPSRHEQVSQAASMALMLNCAGAAFEVMEWSGSLPFELPGEQAFDLVSKRTKRKLGRVGLARELHEPFLDRVQFPDEWVLVEDCGLEHDGWQGEGILDLELACGKDVAMLRMYPWLAYGCSIGARINIRNVSDAKGQCATVHRILGDDRIVARVDGFAKEVGVKAEVIVDIQPSTVVPTAGPGYTKGDKLLLLHKGKLVDAVVMEWVGSTNFQEGSRHMVNVKTPGATTGAPAWPSLNVFNHVAAPPGITSTIFEEHRNSYCQHLISTQDTVEDAITGNSLPIKEQLIFMKAVDVKDGCKPTDYMSVDAVPGLVSLIAQPSPLRVHGGHVAQPVLCRAGPGTGKTWMIKQTLFLLASALAANNAGDGVRLVPFVVFVQRVVRLLSEYGEDAAVLLADPEGMMRWYIRNEMQDNKEHCQLLLLAYDMRACVILVDGVDEAAGMRDVVESFVHYELVVSGNRLVVTSRPEGVDLDDYRRKFVVMNLLELSQEQQRNVIQMQLQGNKFFEHLVNLGECRRDLDALYRKTFHTETIRNEAEDLDLEAILAADLPSEFKIVEAKLEEDAEDVDELISTPLEANPAAISVPPLVRRRISMDNQQDLQAWLAKSLPELKQPQRSAFLEKLNVSTQRSTVAFANLFDQLDIEIRSHPSPCTRAQLESAVAILEEAWRMGREGGPFDPTLRESLLQLGSIRKMPLAGGRRGAKAAPMPAHGLWCQVVRVVDDKYFEVQQATPLLLHIIGRLAAVAGVTQLALKREDFTKEFIPDTAAELAEITYREPVALWLDSTYPGATEPTDEPPLAWVATLLVRCKGGDQLISFVKLLAQGAQLEIDGEVIILKTLSLTNHFNPDTMHPTHLRSVSCSVLVAATGLTMAVRVQVVHTDVLDHYREQSFDTHYSFFWDRVLGLSQATFDQKFETLLLFLVEAIGIPVLLSLLLLTYSSTGDTDLLDIDELPQDRLQLYKLGIMSGIRKRLALAIGSESVGAAEVTDEDHEANKHKRQKRKGALEQNIGGSSSAAATQASSFMERGLQGDPVLDLNSMLRGKKVRVVQGADEVAEAYSLVVRCLERTKNADMRTAISAIVPKSHSLHAVVNAFVEFVLSPISQNETVLQASGKKMLRDVAVDNQQNGRREFTSKHVACTLGAAPEELSLWTRLDLDPDNGVALTATLSKQSEKAPAQYQFKHLSFQEGLYAEYLLMLIEAVSPPQGPGWRGWMTDAAASEFLNNRYMNNTCRIAAGHLGSLLAKQRAQWDFREAPLTPNGRQALWFITEHNDKVASINVAHNEVSIDDVAGLSKTISTCSSLQMLDLSENELHHLSTDAPAEWKRMCESLSDNTTLTSLNLNANRLGSSGVRVVSRALLGCTALKRLGLSFNEPGIEPAMADLFRSHPALVSVELVEAVDRHFPNRAKDDIGRALIENKARSLGFLHCDNFTLSEGTTSLVWPKEASTSDAVLLAGALVTNTVLTTFNIASGATLANAARSALGEALLNNPGSRLAFCNDFGLQPNVVACEFDLSKPELKEVEPFRLLAGCLRGNRTLTHVTLKQLRSEQISTLALALRGNSTLNQLDLIHASRVGGQSVVRLPVPELNGTSKSPQKRVDMSPACLEGNLGRVACEIIGTLIGSNTILESIDLSNTGLGLAIGSDGEGGHILLRPMCESKLCPLNEINLTNVQLNDKAGVKLLSALSVGLGKKMSGYEKITSLSLANNELGEQTGHLLKEVLWGERAPCNLRYLDLSSNVDIAGHDIALAIRRNESLTALDIRNIPSANNDTVFSSIGSFLLQEECACRLGYLSCDVFCVVADQEELRLTPPPANAPSSEPMAGGAPPPTDKKKELAAAKRREAVLMLLAGILKFNSSLKTVEINRMDLDDAAAPNFHLALKENTTIETFDISDNPVGAKGIARIAEAVRFHPALTSFKVDGAGLPVRGVKGATDARLDMADWGLGPLSGHAIGTIAMESTSLTDINLKNNHLGPDGAAAVVNGLGEAPIRTLDITRNGIGLSEGAAIDTLSNAICRNLGLLYELRMDENELECDAEELAPLCKLRSLRAIAMDKNRLTALPNLIGTLLSLRKISLHTNQLTALPTSICLLVSLDTLDLHKNLIRTLPTAIGNLRALQRLDLSENKIVELPSSICELTDAVALSVGRNPLEKPSIEQARQGIGAIRRFFGFNKSRAVDEPLDAAVEKAMRARADSKADSGDDVRAAGAPEALPPGRPEREEGAPSRHDWAGPASLILLFNCFGCSVSVLDGSGDVETVSQDEAIDLTAAFNLQVVGRVRPGYNRSRSEPFAERVEFHNMWLPWRMQDTDSAESPALAVTLKWTAHGLGKQSATLIVQPWLAYGCSVGARIKTGPTSYATISVIREDDSCEMTTDNTTHNVALLGPELIDPRPDTVGRTTSPSYKVGQKLLLMYEGIPQDAVVEEWLGMRRGSRHRVRLIKPGTKGGKEKAGAASGGADGKEKQRTIEVDLNEANHTKLLFATVTKYESTRQAFCDLLSARHKALRDEATIPGKDLPVGDHRLLMRSWVPVAAEAHVAEEGEGAKDADETDGVEDGAAAVAAPKEPAPDPVLDAANEAGAGRTRRRRNSGDLRGPAVPVVQPAPGPPQGAASEGVAGEADAMQLVSVRRLVDELVAEIAPGIAPQPMLFRAGTAAEHELLHAQVVYTLATQLRDSMAQMGAIRLVPLPISGARLAELMADEQMAKKPPREIIVKAFELDNPGYAEMIKQAMEMRATVAVVKVADEADVAAMQQGMLDELLANRLLVTCCASGPEDSEGPRFPQALTERGLCKQLSAMDMVLKRAKVVDKDCKVAFKRMRLHVEGYWPLVRSMHMAFSEVGREGLAELLELLGSRACGLQSLDLSLTQVEAFPCVHVLRSNASLTALDMRHVPMMRDLYQTMADVLLEPESSSRLAHFRCDAFELLEGQTHLSLRERVLSEVAQPGAIALLAALLKRNTTLQELDLSAADVENPGARALAAVLPLNGTLSSLRLPFNPALDEKSKDALRSAARERDLLLQLEL